MMTSDDSFKKAALAFIEQRESGNGEFDYRGNRELKRTDGEQALISEEISEVWSALDLLKDDEFSELWVHDAINRHDSIDAVSDSPFHLSERASVDDSPIPINYFGFRSSSIYYPLAGLLSIVVLAIFLVTGSATGFTEYETNSFDQRLVRLEDGSTILMNRNSRLMVRETATERIVKMDRGEAFFTVARNEKKAFVVRNRDVLTKVLGTSFNIADGESGVEVTVSTGIVSVDNTNDLKAAVRLVSGDSIAVDDVKLTVKHDVDLDAALAWRDGFINFKRKPLGEVVSEMNSFHNNRIQIMNTQKRDQLFTGNVKVDDLTAFLKAVQVITGAKIRYADNGAILIE